MEGGREGGGGAKWRAEVGRLPIVNPPPPPTRPSPSTVFTPQIKRDLREEGGAGVVRMFQNELQKTREKHPLSMTNTLGCDKVHLQNKTKKKTSRVSESTLKHQSTAGS